MTRPPVSVVVPTRGRATLVDDLLAALQPVVGEEAGDEVLLVDASVGADAVAVADVARRHGARLVRAHPGVARQRNAGVAAARHDLLWFVDSDCEPEPGALQRLLGALVASEAAAAAGRVVLRGRRSTWVRAAEATGVVASFDGFGALPGEELPWAVTANLLVRRPRLLDVGGFCEALPAGEDVDLGLRLQEVGGTVWVPAAVVHHRTDTWTSTAAAIGRFLRYGAADAHLLHRHPQLRGPAEPSVVNLAPVVALAVAARSRELGAAVAGTAAWAVLSLLVLARSRRAASGAVPALCSAVLTECLHAGRQLEALRRGMWRSAFSGIVLDAAQRSRERDRRRRTALALVAGATPVLARGRS